MNIMEEFDKASDEVERDYKSYDYDNENVFEFIKNCDIMTVCVSQGRLISKITRLAELYPDEVQIVARNKNNSIVAHMPVSYLHISRSKREMTDEQREAAAERLKNYHKQKNNQE